MPTPSVADKVLARGDDSDMMGPVDTYNEFQLETAICLFTT